MDKTTLPMLILAIASVLGGMVLEGGSPASLLNLPAAVIVIGGTFGVAFCGFPFHIVANVPKLFVVAIMDKPINLVTTVDGFVRLSDKARREGLLALEQEAATLHPFAQKGVMLVVDGSDPHLVREIMEGEIAAIEQRHKSNAAIFDALGGFGPTLGIIGTVMGLINVLGNLSDPDSLGPAISGAFIATLYGVFSANVLFLPLGTKLKQKSSMETQALELMVEGVLAVQAGDNPRVLKEKLESYLPPGLRGRAKNEKAGAGAKSEAATAAA
ncbi:MAG: flagellar motor protein [Chloroflexota bacterium]